jgi:flagella basal body P-ring formation protein FlgA
MRASPESHRSSLPGLIGLLYFFLSLSAGQSAERLRIVIPSRVPVKGESISLATLLKLEGPTPTWAGLLNNSIVALSPPLGKSREIPGVEILRRLESLGITTDQYAISVPTVVQVERESLAVTPHEIEAKVVSEFLPRLHWDRVQLDAIEIPESVLVPRGNVSLNIESSPHTDYAKPFYLKVGFLVDGRLEKTSFFKTRLGLIHSVPVAVKDLVASEKITASDVRWEERTLESTLHPPVSQVEFFQCRRPRQTIGAGRVLTEDLFVSVPLIKRGESVTLLFQTNKIRITAQGKSLESGLKGERIRVLNVDSKMELHAEIVDEKTVRVGPLSQ